MTRLSSRFPFLIFAFGLLLVGMLWFIYLTDWKDFEYQYLILPTVLLAFLGLFAFGFSQVWESENEILLKNTLTQREFEFGKGSYRVQPLFGGILGKILRIDVVITENRAFYYIKRLFYLLEG